MTDSQTVLVLETGTSTPEDIARLREAGILVLETTGRVQVITPVTSVDRLAYHAVTVLQNLPNNEQARRISALLADRLLDDAARELKLRTTTEVRV